MSKYTVKLVGVDSEDKPLTMQWGSNLSAIEAASSVMMLLAHKEEAKTLGYGSDKKLFNGEIVVSEDGKFEELVALFKAGDVSEALYRAEEELSHEQFIEFAEFATKATS